MKNMIKTFSALGARLLGFGDDDATRAGIDSACRGAGRSAYEYTMMYRTCSSAAGTVLFVLRDSL